MSAHEPELSVELTRLRSLSPRVQGLSLRILGPAQAWHAGQYVELSLDGTSPPLPYSIASAPSAARPGEFELAVSWSSDHPQLAVGALLHARGPFGSLLRKEPREGPILLVAAGTGLAPLRALIQEDVARGGKHPVTLLFGCRNQREILWQEELQELCEAEPRFRFLPSLSRPEDDWPGRRGYVQSHLPELLDATPGAEVYLCGLTEMVRDCRLLLEKRGLPPDFIIGEAY